MAKINISEFNRPGIYTRETDKSTIRQVVVDNNLYYLVPGFSRKGPVNRPVLISSQQELVETFGEVDRSLEKKGSFFHRTILNLLGTGPVWAVNLLSTNDELDKLDWVSIATSSTKSNSRVKKAPLSDFYDKSDFWYLDSEQFVQHAKANSDGEILHIANLAARKSSVFIYKSNNPTYAQTLEMWFGGKASVPAYLHHTDLVSDYLVNMVIVSGDWSDYKSLSVDSRWSKYFTKSGLKKDLVQQFVNDAAVTTLKQYSDLSLIPYFKSAAGTDMNIETVVNKDTTTTGIFIGYDIAAIDDLDYSTGLLDLVGNNLINDNKEAINYLSYSENISELVTFKASALNRAGNVIGAAATSFETKVIGDLGMSRTHSNGTTNLKLNASSITAVIIGGVEVKPSATNNTVSVADASVGKVRRDTLYLDATGSLGVKAGVEVDTTAASWDAVPLATLSGSVVPVGYVSVGTITTTGVAALTSSATLTGSVGTTNLLMVSALMKIENLTVGIATSSDLIISYVGTNSVVLTFKGTGATTDLDYKKLRLNALFTQAQSNIKAGTSVILDKDGVKVTITSVLSETDGDKSLTITVPVSVDVATRAADAQVFFVNDELVFGTKGAKTTAGGDFGTVATGSAFYQAYVSGQINSGDYFYPAFYAQKFDATFAGSTIKLTTGVAATNFENKAISITGTVLNDGLYQVSSAVSATGVVTLTVDKTVKSEIATGVSVLDATEKVYLKMYFMNRELSVEFSGADLIGNKNVTNVARLNEIQVLSKRNNFKQSLEIDTILETNRILVSADLYSNVKVGDFLKAFVAKEDLEAGQVGKYLTRVVSKKLYAANPSLVEIATDSQIDITYFGANATEAQTFRYSSIEDYVSTYSAIVLDGFKVREDSMPNGTEARQSEILNMIGRGTPMFKGLVNKNKISWRYLVDAFSLGLTSNSKHQLADLAGERLTAFAIINMPSAKDFKNSTATSFLDSKTKSLNTEYILKGGNPASNPAFLYTMAEGKGASNSGYFFPHVVINDNGRSVVMPPASFIANTFMNKHTSRLASVKPWSVAAGLTNGLVSGFVNVEFDLTGEDIGNINALGANPIVYKMNRGFCIETDNTAQVYPKSGLSQIHVREALVELEEELYQMLLGFQSAFNTSEVRDLIKSQADDICQRYVRENALYAFVNTVDEDVENIDLGVGILNTAVEPVKAMGIIINDITILKTGDIKSGGFQAQ